MELYEAVGRIEGGKVRMSNRPAFDAACRELDGRDVLVTVRRLRATRSGQANRYYWSAVLGTLSEHTGHTPEELHEVFKGLFLPKEAAFRDGNGTVVNAFVIGGSTTRLNSKEFAEYINRIKTWSLDTLGVLIPDSYET